MNVCNVCLRECELDASYSYFNPVARVANLQVTRGNAIYVICDNSVWLPEDRHAKLNRFHKKLRQYNQYKIFSEEIFLFFRDITSIICMYLGRNFLYWQFVDYIPFYFFMLCIIICRDNMLCYVDTYIKLNCFCVSWICVWNYFSTVCQCMNHYTNNQMRFLLFLYSVGNFYFKL